MPEFDGAERTSSLTAIHGAWASLLAASFADNIGYEPSVDAYEQGGLVGLAGFISDRDDAVVCYCQSFGLAGDYSLWLSASEAVWHQVDRVVAEESKADGAAGRWKILNHLSKRVAGYFAGKPGRAISAGEWMECPGSESAEALAISLHLRGTEPLLVNLGMNASLREQLADYFAAGTPGANGLQGTSGDSSHQEEPFMRGGLDVVMDIEMPVSVVLGRAALTIGDLLKLRAGSLVELDAGSEDPVQVTVNQSVLARGEVVVVEGNYGVRILKMMERTETPQTIPPPRVCVNAGSR